jgi:hypothetical protein
MGCRTTVIALLLVFAVVGVGMDVNAASDASAGKLSFVLETGKVACHQGECFPSGEAVFPFDFDLDGDLDIIVPQKAIDETKNEVPRQVLAFENDGTGNFRDVTRRVLGKFRMSHPWMRLFLDVNNDGRMDILWAESGVDCCEDQGGDLDGKGGQNKVLIQTRRGKLKNQTKKRLPYDRGFTHGLCGGDFDGDGDQDVYVVNHGSFWFFDGEFNPGHTVWMNDGTGVFQAEPQRLPEVIRDLGPDQKTDNFHLATYDCVATDVDLDGDIDLIGGANARNLRDYFDTVPTDPERDLLLLNNGAGFFAYADVATQQQYLPKKLQGSYRVTHNLKLIDMNGDGLDDLLVSMEPTNDNPDLVSERINLYQVMLRKPSGGFRAIRKVAKATCEPWFTNPADFNLDGLPDFLATGSKGPELVMNRDKGRLKDKSGLLKKLRSAFLTIPDGCRPDLQGTAPADLDGDGDLDIYAIGLHPTDNKWRHYVYRNQLIK